MQAKRIGLMGCGTVADYGHAPTILKTNGLSLHALFDPDKARLRKFAAKFKVSRAFTDEAAFFASGIDAVAITSPAPFHPANALAACRHGKDVLCEKPLAMTVVECEGMIQAAEKAGVMLFTGFDYRFSPASQTIHRLIRERAIGEVRSLRLIYIWNCHGKWTKDAKGRRVENARRAGRMLEGGPMVDCGVHQIDLARWWLGSEVVRWSAAGAWIDDFDAPDHVYLHMEHANRAQTLVEMSYSYCHTSAEPVNVFTYEFIGTEGVIRYDRGQKVFEVRSVRGTEKLPFAPEKNFAGMYSAFSRALSTRDPGDLPTARDGLIAVRISREATDAVMEKRGK